MPGWVYEGIEGSKAKQFGAMMTIPFLSDAAAPRHIWKNYGPNGEPTMMAWAYVSAFPDSFTPSNEPPSGPPYGSKVKMEKIKSSPRRGSGGSAETSGYYAEAAESAGPGISEKLAGNFPKVSMVVFIAIEIAFMVICSNRANLDTFGGIMIELFSLAFGAVLGWLAHGLISAGVEGRSILAYVLAFILFALTFVSSMHKPEGNPAVIMQVVFCILTLLVAFMRSRRNAS